MPGRSGEQPTWAGALLSASLTRTCPVCAVKIAKKWGKFSTAEIAGLEEKADLVASSTASNRAQAQRDVDAFAKGRQL